MLVLGSAASVMASAARPFVPEEHSGSTLRLEGDAWRFEGAGYSGRIRSLAREDRQAYLRRAAEANVDPFASPPGAAPRFLTFLLELDNRRAPGITIQPQNCWLVTKGKRILLPLSLEDLAASYHILELEMPAAYNRVRPALMESSWTLAPGESASGLLVYRAPEARTKSFRLELQLTMSNGDVARFAAPYRRAKRQRGTK